MYRRNNPLKIGKGYREQDLLTLRVELTVARVEYCKRDKNYFSYTYIRVSIGGVCTKKWTNLDDLSPDFLWLRVQSIRRVWNEKYFPRIDVSFRTFPIQANNVHETMFREIFSALDYYKIIVYRSRLEGTRFIHVRYRTIKRIDALFLTERIHALRALHACTVSSRELDSTSWTNSSTRFPVSLFPTEENSCRKEQCSITFANPSIRNVIF